MLSYGRPKARVEPWGGLGGVASPPQRNALSRILRRVAPRSPWIPGAALRRGALGPFGIAAMRCEALGLASFQGPPRAPRGLGFLRVLRDWLSRGWGWA